MLAALYTAIFAEPRYRLPIFMLLVPFAVIALAWLWRTGKAVAAGDANRTWKREGLAAVGVAAAVFACAPAIAWAGGRLRDGHRWVVHECSVDGRAQYCKWRASGVGGDLGDRPALRGAWNGVGLALSSGPHDAHTTLAGQTEIPLQPGDYAVTFSVDLAPKDTAVATGELRVSANGRPIGDALSMDTVAAATRQGSTVSWPAKLGHDGGPLLLQVQVRDGAGHPPVRLWLSDLRVTRLPSSLESRSLRWPFPGAILGRMRAPHHTADTNDRRGEPVSPPVRD